jgi:hypothetical protein
MVTFGQLREAKPYQWLTAGDEWRTRAGTALSFAKRVRQQREVVKDAWSESAARDQAVTKLTDLMNQLLITSVEHRAVSIVCKGLGHVLKISQDLLLRGVDTAERLGMRIDEDGTVHQAPNSAPSDRVATFDSAYQQATYLIDTAIDTASRADRQAHDALVELADAVDERSLEHALDEDLGNASRLEMRMIADALPDGNAWQNAAWWQSLSPEDHELLKRAAAPELQDLVGIPDDVKRELRGSAKFDRAGAAGWAEDHWDDTSDDNYDNNCTNFTSNALREGGDLKYRWGLGGVLDDDSWGKAPHTGWDDFDVRTYRRSSSWVQAPDLKDFMLEHGGSEVSQTDARPGDIVFWENPDGTIHHAAVVTGAVDGDLRYTQHSGGRLDASLGDRGEVQENTDGGSHQKIHIVRVNPNW